MTIASANNFASGGGGPTISYGTVNTAGNLLVCVFRGHATSTVTDSIGNTGWARAISIANGGEGQNIWYCPNCKGGGNTVTISEYQSGNIGEYSGVATLGPTSSNTGSGNPYSSAAVVATKAALIIGGVSNESANNLTDTPTGGFVDEISDAGNAFFADQIVSAGTYNYGGSYSSNVNWATTAAVFYPAAPSVYSQPDCRVTKPSNATSETQNATLLYDKQTSSNSAIPPTDSRVSKPTASGTYPQNSRNPSYYP
jgi:hypothetical protein